MSAMNFQLNCKLLLASTSFSDNAQGPSIIQCRGLSVLGQKECVHWHRLCGKYIYI